MSAHKETFGEFWLHYLHDHAHEGTRALHFFGSGVGALSLVAGVLTLNPAIAAAGIGLGYLFAWIGHLAIEHNQPSMFKHPVWSFMADLRMCRLFFLGQLDAELRKAHVEAPVRAQPRHSPAPVRSND